jgi:hypothetical protein
MVTLRNAKLVPNSDGRHVGLITQELDGKKIAYSTETCFYVQVGKGAKGAYRTQYSFKGKLTQAVLYFNGINIGNGYKKRLRMENKTLVRVTS